MPKPGRVTTIGPLDIAVFAKLGLKLIMVFEWRENAYISVVSQMDPDSDMLSLPFPRCPGDHLYVKCNDAQEAGVLADTVTESAKENGDHWDVSVLIVPPQGQGHLDGGFYLAIGLDGDEFIEIH